MFTVEYIPFTFLKIIFNGLAFHLIFYPVTEGRYLELRLLLFHTFISLAIKSLQNLLFQNILFPSQTGDLIQVVFFHLDYCDSLTTLPCFQSQTPTAVFFLSGDRAFQKSLNIQ